MGCCHSFSILNDYFQIPHPASSVITNNRSAAMSINGDTDDTVPLTSSKNKKSNRDLLIHNEKNFSRIIPLLEERDPSSTFESVKDSRCFSNLTNKTDSSSSSIASLENGLSNTINENVFLNQDNPLENTEFNQNQGKNSSQFSNSRENISSNQMNIPPMPEINLLYNQNETIFSTEDEGGISGEMDSSFDDT